MLKNIMDKYTEQVPVSDRVNVVDMLTAESAQDQLKLLFVGMSETCQELEKFEQVGEQLKNESGLVTYLASQGYEYLTTESAGEVAKEVWIKIKKAIAYLIDQFMIYFNKAKLLFMNLINNHEGKIKALLAILERVKKNGTNATLMDSESFGKRIPHFENFHDVTAFTDYINLIKKSSSAVYYMDNKGIVDIENYMHKHFDLIYTVDTTLAFLGFEGSNMLSLVINKLVYNIKTVAVTTTYNPVNKITMKPESIKKVLESLLDILKELKSNVNKISEKMVKYKSPEPEKDGVLGVENIQHNISVTIRASKLFLENNNKMIKDLIFIMTQHIKCYENTKDKTDNLLNDEDRYKRDKSIIEDAISEKDWVTLEGMFNSKSIKDFPDLVKMIEDALKNKK